MRFHAVNADGRHVLYVHAKHVAATEYDIAVAESAYQEYVDSGRKSTPVKDFWRELDEEV